VKIFEDILLEYSSYNLDQCIMITGLHIRWH